MPGKQQLVGRAGQARAEGLGDALSPLFFKMSSTEQKLGSPPQRHRVSMTESSRLRRKEKKWSKYGQCWRLVVQGRKQPSVVTVSLNRWGVNNTRILTSERAHTEQHEPE